MKLKPFKQAIEWAQQETSDFSKWMVGLTIDKKLHLVLINSRAGWVTKRYSNIEDAKQAYNETLEVWKITNQITTESSQ